MIRNTPARWQSCLTNPQRRRYSCKQMKITTIRTVIPDDHRLLLDVPEDVPPGPAEVVVRPIEAVAPARGTGADLLASGLLGIWKDRTDITDSVKFARELRQQAEQRRDG